MRAPLALLVLSVHGAGTVAADPIASPGRAGARSTASAVRRPIDLRVKRLPGQMGFRMRVAQSTPEPEPDPELDPELDPDAEPEGDPEPGEEPFLLRRRRREGVRRSVAERVTARLDLGLAVDGSKPSGAPSWDHVRVREAIAADPSRYSSVRAYGFGELYLGTRGIGMPTLSSYVSAQARFANPIGSTIAPIMSPYDRATDGQTRAIWLESDGLFTSKWLKPVRARAGRMYIYGPAIVHTDALLVAWEKHGLEASWFSGRRVPDFRIDENALERERAELVSGGELRIDLRRWSLPIVAGASTLRYNGHSHSNLTGTWVPRRNMVVRSSSRFRDGDLAEQRLVIRSRLSQESTVIVDSRLRTRADWFWDYASLTTVENPEVFDDAAARAYLGLGLVQPRLESALIAGTVIASNIDLLARGAIALDTSGGSPTTTVNPHLPVYIEGGAAVEVRVRRALAVSGSVLVRDYSRPRPLDHTDVELIPLRGPAQLLPMASEMGEESLIEAGVTTRYSAGARRFSVQAELYGRQTLWAPLYDRREWTTDGNKLTDEQLSDIHGGGRITLDAWVNPQVRLRGEYDITTQLATQPEFRGLKQLRLLLEGTY